MLMPGEFMPMAEQSYLMRELTAWVTDAAMAQAARWRQDGLGVPVSINLSARDLLDSGLPESLERSLDRYSLPPDALILEIKELVLASEPAHAVATAEALVAAGMPLSLDDFGTGYSSLVRLRRLPVSEIKIDASFVNRLGSPGDQVIVRSLVELMRALGIRSVAEGVESSEAAAALADMGCDAAQGWHFSGPLAAGAATEWLAGQRAPRPREAEPGPSAPASRRVR
jgi:EAL domain-containing protein (putative c-di-GMP-specific phosphodiesterase class I)